LLDFDGYAAYLAGGAFIVLSRLDSGSESNLGFAATSYSPGDVLRLECEGTTIRVLYNDSEVISVTDATYSSGKCALGSESTTGGWDDLAVEHVETAINVNPAAVNLELTALSPTLALSLPLAAESLELTALAPTVTVDTPLPTRMQTTLTRSGPAQSTLTRSGPAQTNLGRVGPARTELG
jgi:hypothetical protein